jgi:FtsH-binding integral membrane protein
MRKVVMTLGVVHFLPRERHKMSYLVDGYHRETVAAAPVSARVQFIRRTYAHLAVAIAAFVGIEAVLFSTGLGLDIMRSLFAFNGAWLGLMLLFIVGGIAAQMMARSRSSPGLQYAGLTLYVLLEVVIFLPILMIAEARFPGQHLPIQAGVVTLAVFAGLTAAVFWSGKDFSFLGPMLWVCSFLAFGLLIAAMIGGFNLGLVFTVVMVALAAGFIIYDTSNIIHHYATDQYVAASLNLFASVALLFWYILQFFMNARDDG